jgi:hypothetical protein
MTPVTRHASIHVASHTTRYDYLNAAKKNIATTDDKQQQQQQQDYDQECFEDRSDAACCGVSTRRTNRNSKVNQKQTQTTIAAKKTVAFAKQQAPAPAQQAQQQQHEQQPTGKRVSKRQAAKYDAQIEAVEAANILASIAAAAAAAAGPKERTPPYWTRQHERTKAGARFQKAMTAVLQCD